MFSSQQSVRDHRGLRKSCVIELGIAVCRGVPEAKSAFTVLFQNHNLQCDDLNQTVLPLRVA
jgi:hypothetical protein